jgi:hypothetical protein
MDSDSPSVPEETQRSFFQRNIKLIGIIAALVIVIASLSYFYFQGEEIDAEFARENALKPGPNQSLEHWYIAYMTESRVYNFEVVSQLGENMYEIRGSDDKLYELTFYQEEENGTMQWYAQFEGSNVSSSPEEIVLFFNLFSYIDTGPFTAIPETAGYKYIEDIYLLFDAWENEGVENQQLAYGMSEISKSVAMRLTNNEIDIDHMKVGEIDDEHFIKMYKGEIATPTNPVIYIMTEPGGASKPRVIIPYDGLIIIEIPNYQNIPNLCRAVANFITPSGGGSSGGNA